MKESGETGARAERQLLDMSRFAFEGMFFQKSQM